jgi:hypothetical protein
MSNPANQQLVNGRRSPGHRVSAISIKTKEFLMNESRREDGRGPIAHSIAPATPAMLPPAQDGWTLDQPTTRRSECQS